MARVKRSLNAKKKRKVVLERAKGKAAFEPAESS